MTGPDRNFAALHRRFPTSAWMRRGAPKGVPFFAYEFGDSGAGNDGGIAANWAALDALRFVPRYGTTSGPAQVGTRLFGRDYAAPLGMSPVGGLSVVWPGAERLMAAAAQARRTPYVLPVAGGATVEEIAAIAPDVTWMQMYRFAANDHAIGRGLLARVAAAGVDVLVMTMDVPVRTTRSREARSGLTAGFRPDLPMIVQSAMRPRWLMAMLRHGFPRFSMLRGYVGENAGTNEVISFARREMGGAFSWDEVALYRQLWKGKLVVKGILHPEDAERAVSLGVDGIWVSNHGGRQVEGLATSADCLPGIVSAVGGRATVLVDSGIRGGQDVARCLKLGADAAFAGKAFLWSLAAIGDAGPRYALDLMIDELASTLSQAGAGTLEDIRRLEFFPLKGTGND